MAPPSLPWDWVSTLNDRSPTVTSSYSREPAVPEEASNWSAVLTGSPTSAPSSWLTDPSAAITLAVWMNPVVGATAGWPAAAAAAVTPGKVPGVESVVAAAPSDRSTSMRRLCAVSP